jgi:hypothetical protein
MDQVCEQQLIARRTSVVAEEKRRTRATRFERETLP